MEEPLHVGLGWRAANDHVRMDEGEILALPGCEVGSRISGDAIHLCPRHWGDSDECTEAGTDPAGGRQRGRRRVHGVSDESVTVASSKAILGSRAK